MRWPPSLTSWGYQYFVRLSFLSECVFVCTGVGNGVEINVDEWLSRGIVCVLGFVKVAGLACLGRGVFYVVRF